MLSSRVTLVPLPSWYSPTQPPACQLTINVIKPRLSKQLAAKLFAPCSNVNMNYGYVQVLYSMYMDASKVKVCENHLLSYVGLPL